MPYYQLVEAFKALTPTDKALFINMRLAWASGNALCQEVTQRICKPTSDGIELRTYNDED